MSIYKAISYKDYKAISLNASLSHTKVKQVNIFQPFTIFYSRSSWDVWLQIIDIVSTRYSRNNI